MALGRPKNIKSPEHLWNIFQDYVVDSKEKEKEWTKIQYVGKDGERKIDSLKIPLTFEGLKRYAWEIGIGTIEQYFTNQDNLYTEYIGICSHIKNSIRENQIIGGMLNVFNPSITQRLNNLSDNTDITSGGKSLKQEPITVKISRPLEDID